MFTCWLQGLHCQSVNQLMVGLQSAKVVITSNLFRNLPEELRPRGHDCHDVIYVSFFPLLLFFSIIYFFHVLCRVTLNSTQLNMFFCIPCSQLSRAKWTQRFWCMFQRWLQRISFCSIWILDSRLQTPSLWMFADFLFCFLSRWCHNNLQ